MGFSDAQVARLSRFLTVAVCFDADAASQRRARRLADALTPFGVAAYVVRLRAKDAATALLESPDELRELRARFLD